MNYLDILIKLRKIIRSVNLESKRIEKEYGVSIPQLLTLQYLATSADYKSTAKHIKSYLNLNASTVSGILTRLEAKELLVKIPNHQNKRLINITLTAKGLALVNKTPITLQEKLSSRLEKLSENQIKELIENIDLLTSLLDAENIDASPILTSKELN